LQKEEDAKELEKFEKREEAKDAAKAKTESAREESAYLGHVIEYYNSKLDAFKKMEKAMDAKDDDDNAVLEYLAPKKVILKGEIAAL
jgi:hypothetical protein